MWPLILSGALTAGGALLGKSERPTIDPEMLKMLFGPGALAGDTQQLYQMLLNSPVFSQLMNSASLQGTQLGQNMRARLGQAGIPGSPLGAFADAASRGYGQTFQRNQQAQLFLKAMMEASSNLQTRAGIWGNSQLQRQSQPTWGRMIGASMLNAGAQGLSQWTGGSQKAGDTGNQSVLSPEQPKSWWDVINQKPSQPELV